MKLSSCDICSSSCCAVAGLAMDNARGLRGDEVAPQVGGRTYLTAPTNTRSAYDTTYSRMTTPRSEERATDPESLEWHQFHIVTEDQSETRLRRHRGVDVRRQRSRDRYR
jgi:hypothetical protein